MASRIKGVSIQDLDMLTIGMDLDIWTEKANDSVKYKAAGGTVREATQKDFDHFEYLEVPEKKK